MDVASLSVGVDANISPLQRRMNQAAELLNRFSSLAGSAGRVFDANFSTSVDRSARSINNNLEQIRNRMALLTQKQSLVIDTSSLARVNRELAMLRTQEEQLQNIGLPTPSSSSVSGLVSYAGGMLSIGTAIGLVKQGFGIIQEFDRLNSGLKAVSSSSLDYARSQAFLQGLSNRLGVSFESLASSYKGLKAATNGTNLEGAETERIFSAVVKAGAALKLSNDDLQGSLRAVTQILATGTVQSDELKNELGNRLPGAVQLLANALGVGTKELFRMLEQGEILSSDALPKLARELEKTYGAQAQANVNSMAGGVNRLTSESGLLISALGESAGVNTFFGKLTNGFADSLQGLRQLVKDESWGKLATSLALMTSPQLQGVIGQPYIDDAADKNKNQAFYASLPRGSQKAVLVEETNRVRAIQARIQANEQAGISDARALVADRRLIVEKKAAYAELYKIYQDGIKLDAERRKSAANNKATGASPLEQLERNKKQYEADLKTREALIRANKPVGNALVQRINTFEAGTKRVEAITKPDKGTGRATLAKDNYLSSSDLIGKKIGELKKQVIDEELSGRGLSVLAKNLADLKSQADQLQLDKKIVPQSLLNRIDEANKKLQVSEARLNQLDSLQKQQKSAEAIFDRLTLTGDVRRLSLRTGLETKRAADRFEPTRTRPLVNINQTEGGVSAVTAFMGRVPQLIGNNTAPLIGASQSAKPGFNLDKAQENLSKQVELLNAYEDLKRRFDKLGKPLKRAMADVAGAAGLIDTPIVAGLGRVKHIIADLKVPNASGPLKAGSEQVRKILDQTNEDQRKIDETLDRLDKKKETLKSFGEIGKSVGKDLIGSLGKSLGERNLNPFKSALQSVLDMLGDYLIQLGAALLLASKLEAAAGTIPGLQGFIFTATQKLIVGASLVVGGAGIKAIGAKAFAGGGPVLGEGGPLDDKIPAMLSNGEFVIRAAAVRQIGIPALNQLNQGTMRLALGGVVSPVPSYPSPPRPTYSADAFKNVSGTVTNTIQVTVEGKTKVRGADTELALARAKRNRGFTGRDD